MVVMPSGDVVFAELEDDTLAVTLTDCILLQVRNLSFERTRRGAAGLFVVPLLE